LPSVDFGTDASHDRRMAASMDFFTVPTIIGRTLFVLVLLSQHRRRIVQVNITDHLTANVGRATGCRRVSQRHDARLGAPRSRLDLR
jgi:hypothetical protein